MTHHSDSTVFSPWAKPTGICQAMARYQTLYGIKPVGPHRPLADSLLKDILCKCDACAGTGLNGAYGSLGYRICPVCHGLGDTYSITLDALQALRQQVLDRYPDAAPPNWTPGQRIFCPVHDLATGLILDACPRTSPETIQGQQCPDDEGQDEAEAAG